MHSLRIYHFNVWYIHYWWIVTRLNATVFIYFKGNHGESGIVTRNATVFIYFKGNHGESVEFVIRHAYLYFLLFSHFFQ